MLEGTWYPTDYKPDGGVFRHSWQRRHLLEMWLSSRTPEDKERYRLEEKEERETIRRNAAWKEQESIDREERRLLRARVHALEKAREEVSKRRRTPWIKERKDLDAAIRGWIREEELELEQEAKYRQKWNRKVKSATRFHGTKSSRKIEAAMELQWETEKSQREEERFKNKQARIAKFEAMSKAEADRWTEELKIATADEEKPRDEGELGHDHRKNCMPSSYTSTHRRVICAVCRDDEDLGDIEWLESQGEEARAAHWRSLRKHGLIRQVPS